MEGSLTSTDLQEIVIWFLSSYGVGYLAGFLHRSFKLLVEKL